MAEHKGDEVVSKIDGAVLKNMIICGTNRLVANKERINALNVFPVPDGDTGTNMSLTALAAAKEVEKIDTLDIYDVSKVAASGALRGGRGNSGVIFSQLFRGFSKALVGLKQAGVAQLALCLEAASVTAYKAVMRPQEGTMLTVARHMAEVAKDIAEDAYGTESIEDFIKQVLDEGHKILKRTPDMLPVLKQAGVVDSGGDGLLCFLSGALEGLKSKNAVLDDINAVQAVQEVSFAALGSISAEDIEFGYCTEFFINVKNFSQSQEDDFKGYMQTMGDSIALVCDEEIVKVHIHTNNPGAVMEHAVNIGPLSSIKIENMRFQHHNAVTFLDESQNKELFSKGAIKYIKKDEKNEELKDIAIVVVCVGEGFRRIFLDLGADYVVEGGQSMNPSAKEIVLAIKQAHAKNVIVLPNNKNIILAAGLAKKLIEEDNDMQCEVTIVPSHTLPQGISAMVAYMPEDGLSNNVGNMKDAMQEVVSGLLTHAVRDTTVDGKDIKEGDYISIIDGEITSFNKYLMPLGYAMIDDMMKDGCDVLSIFEGKDAQEEDTILLIKYIRDKYPSCELHIEKGGQPIYYYIISAE